MPLAISIELGGSHAAIGLLSDRALLAIEEFVVEPGAKLSAILPRLERAVQSLVKTNGLRCQDFCGVGMSIAALVHWQTNKVAGTNGKYSDAPLHDLSAWSRRCFNLPLRLENDARMALLGEAYASSLASIGSIMMLTFGTGIGCAVMTDGRLFRSSQPQGGCLGGHIPVNLNGRQCNCGAIGCMEAEASTWSLPAIMQAWPGIEQSALSKNLHGGFKALLSQVKEGDHIAKEILSHCVRVWAVGLVGLIYVYGPSVILLGGGIMEAGELLIPKLDAYVRKHALLPGGPIELRRAALGSHAALYGAVPLLMEETGLPVEA